MGYGEGADLFQYDYIHFFLVYSLLTIMFLISFNFKNISHIRIPRLATLLFIAILLIATITSNTFTKLEFNVLLPEVIFHAILIILPISHFVRIHGIALRYSKMLTTINIDLKKDIENLKSISKDDTLFIEQKKEV